MQARDAKFFKAEVLESVGEHLKKEFEGNHHIADGFERCEVRPSDGKSVTLIMRPDQGGVRMFSVTVKEVM